MIGCHECRYFLEHEFGCLLYHNPHMAAEQMRAGLAGKCDEGKLPHKDRFLAIATGQINGEMTDQTRRCPGCGSMSCAGECAASEDK